MKPFPKSEDHTLAELETILKSEDELLSSVLDKLVYEPRTDGFAVPFTETERTSRKRYVCTVLREIYTSTEDENIRKLVVEAGIQVKRMVRALANYKAKE